VAGNKDGIDNHFFAKSGEVHVVTSYEKSIVCQGLKAQYARQLG